ncbi:hypothetical protein CMUS01_10328 [Colletotrichum musicola]|uniref:Uncharacterized protein n=1 Tax=Colletotrichum musicola TaxID=2175873 RepID=A0A8H6K3A1_9PEZI|nr:hypothetical protein CMUS01_10328 [Colletotrichum musicola]
MASTRLPLLLLPSPAEFEWSKPYGFRTPAISFSCALRWVAPCLVLSWTDGKPGDAERQDEPTTASVCALAPAPKLENLFDKSNLRGPNAKLARPPNLPAGVRQGQAQHQTDCVSQETRAASKTDISTSYIVRGEEPLAKALSRLVTSVTYGSFVSTHRHLFLGREKMRCGLPDEVVAKKLMGLPKILHPAAYQYYMVMAMAMAMDDQDLVCVAVGLSCHLRLSHTGVGHPMIDEG